MLVLICKCAEGQQEYVIDSAAQFFLTKGDNVKM